MVETGKWLNQGWEWFVEDLGMHILIGLLAMILLTFGNFIALGPVSAGLALSGVRKAQLGRFELNDFLEGFRFFLPALLASLLILVLVLLGTLFLIIPGLVILGMYLLTFHFMVDQRKDFWQAMEASRRAAANDYFGFTLFTLVLLAVNLLGMAFVWVGLAVTIPVTSLALSAAYLDLAGARLLSPPANRQDARVVK